MKTTLLAATIAALLAATPASAEVLGKEGGFFYVKQEEKLKKGPGPQIDGAVVECPNGTGVTGGGATVTGELAGTAMSSNSVQSPTEWYMYGWHTGINPKSETVTAWAVCTPKVGKISIGSETSPETESPGGNHVVANCPTGHATGGGARVFGSPSSWWLNSIGAVDTADDGETPDDGWVAWLEHQSGPADSFITDVVCMEGKTPIYRDKAKETDKKQIGKKVFCPEGTSATGGGAFASASTADSHITSSAPIDSKKDNDSVPDDGWKAKFFNDNSVEQKFTASVVCR